MVTLAQHLDALLLSLASSTDNFTVGISVGFSHKRLPIWVNAFISICNAAGALVAGLGGVILSQHIPLLAPMLASLAFGVLAIHEFHEFLHSSKTEEKHQFLEISQVIRLAVPMTLNNLAGGVAGGAVGLSPLVSASYALLASFLTMAVGHRIGHRLGKSQMVNPSLVSCCLLGALCLLTLREAFF